MGVLRNWFYPFIILVFFTGALKAQNTLSKQIKTFDSLALKGFRENNFEAYFENYIASETLTEKSTDTLLKIPHYYKHGNIFYHLGLFHQSIELSRKGIALDNDYTNLKEPIFTLLTYTNISKSQNALGLHEEAKKNYRTILKISEKVSQRRVAAASNNLALHFFDYDKNLDSALYYFKKAKKIMTTEDVEGMDLLGFINGNIAEILMEKGDYRGALPYFKTNYYSFFNPNAAESRLKTAYYRSGMAVADVYIKIDQTQNASLLLDSIARKLDTIPPFTNKNDLDLALLKLQREVSIKLKDYEKATTLSLQIETLQDSITKQEEKIQLTGNNLIGNQVTKRYETLLENERLKADSIRQKNQVRFWTVTSILILILGAFVFVSYGYRQRLRMTRKNKELAEEKALTKSLENKLLAQSLEYQKKDLTSLALSTKQNLKWLQNLESKLSKFQKNTNFKKEVFLEELKKMVDDKKRINVFTEELNEKIGSVNTEFYETLTQRFPELSQYDHKLCALIRMNLDSKDMATMMNINPASVNTSKYRLRKKLGLKKEDDLSQFLKSI